VIAATLRPMKLPPEFLARLGVQVIPDFLDRDTCERMSKEMIEASGDRATVTVELTQDELAERYRSTTIADVSDDTVSELRDRLLELEGDLERTFGLELDGCEKPQFLLYGEGDFIRPHSDGSHDDEAPDWLKNRAVATVVFLNDQSDEDAPRTFAGGSLNFLDLLSDESRGRSVGLPIAPTAGLLVAFRADVVHEVTEVTRGDRCTAVSWFASPQ
jgi:predicted 2-oxoglutarate/Fe(II)-dependent dioxygenase YbiX